MNVRRLIAAGGIAGLVVAAGAAGAALFGTANAATPTPSPSASATADANPGDNGADGVPESQEHHGGHGHGLDQSGTVTAVTGTSVTIKTATATTTYAVTGASDIDKNGEASVSDLKVGDAVTFSLSSDGKTIDKLHTGDETKNRPTAAPSSSSAG